MMQQLKVVAPGEVARIVLLVICIGLLLTGSLWILLPFLGALLWATMIVISTWPILLRVQQAAGGRRWVGVLVMTIVAAGATPLHGRCYTSPAGPGEPGGTIAAWNPPLPCRSSA